VTEGRRLPGAGDVVAAGGRARILETGYRPYAGPRLGPRHATWALARHSFERIMGLHRPARYKILPFLTVIIAYLPAVAFVGIVAIIPRERALRISIIPSPGQYYGFITAAIILFAALAAPEALCPDKRSRFLGIYLASPLTRSTYLLAKAMAVAAALLLVTVGPPLLLLIGLALQNYGPRGFSAFMETLGQVLITGVALSAMFGAVSLAIPSLTDRRGFASAGSLLLIVGSGIVAGILAFGLRASTNFELLALNRLPFELALRIFTDHGLPLREARGEDRFFRPQYLSTAYVVAASILVTVIGTLVTWWRVVGTEVTR
jgi:ABC-2 type transport system permease protein